MNCLLVTMRAVLADPGITPKALAIDTGMHINTVRLHMATAHALIAEIRGEPPPPPKKPYKKKNPLKP